MKNCKCITCKSGDIFVECDIGINQDGSFIAIKDIPKVLKAIREFKKLHKGNGV